MAKRVQTVATGHRILRLPSVIDMTGKSRAAVYRDIQNGTFPKPVLIGARAVGWPEESIFKWIDSRIAASDL